MNNAKRIAWKIIIIASITIIFLAHFFGIDQRLDWFIQDKMAIHLRSNNTPHPTIKLILIDDASVNHLGDFIGRYPWPRGIYSPIISYLNKAGAKEIIFDILFSEEEESSSSHQSFLNELQKHDNVSFVGILSKEFPVNATLPPYFEKSKLHVDYPYVDYKEYQSIYHPIPDLSKQSKKIPIANIEPDEDGLYRKLPLITPFRQQWLYTLPLTPFVGTHEISFNNTTIYMDKTKIHLTDNHEIILNWYPKGFDRYSFSGVLSSWQALENNEEPLISPDTFENSIVVIGASAVGLHDLKTTPIHSHLPGAEIQATAISNILQGTSLRLSPNWITYLLICFILTIVPYQILKNPLLKHYLTALLIPITFIGIAILLFLKMYTLLQLGGVIIAFFFSYISAIGYNSYSEYVEKQKVKQTFSMYVSPKILKELSQNYKTIQPEVGKEREVTILFSDIRDFTSITESSPVDQVISLLNEYFDAMIEIIQLHDGTVDKMIGDAIMAFWNAPIKLENHAYLATKAAIEMQTRVNELNKKWKLEGRITIAAGIGINTGPCIIGNIGSKRRVNYTLIGDSVNSTARLESLCKTYKEPILISQNTKSQINDQIKCDFIDNASVKGKTEQIPVFAPREYI